MGRPGAETRARPPALDSDDGLVFSSKHASPTSVTGQRQSRRKGQLQNAHPNPPLTPSTAPPTSMSPQLPNPLLQSAPASPPTPAPSPTPRTRLPVNHPSTRDIPEDPLLRDARVHFRTLNLREKEAWLLSLVETCDHQTLSFLHQIVSPKLKKDPFLVLPNELCFKILEYVDDPKTFVRACLVSRRWRDLVSDDQAWKTLYDKQGYRRMSTDSIGSSLNLGSSLTSNIHFPRSSSPPRFYDGMTSIAESSDVESSNPLITSKGSARHRPKSTHRSQFKHRFMVESAWKKGGHMVAKHITPDQGVVTSLHLTRKYIVVALDNAKIHVFNTKGDLQRTLQGHAMGVWAMIPWEDILVSGGCDRDVRVWNMATGASIHTLRGHTSTVRCLKMSDARTAISGSRDTTLRVWDLMTGQLKRVLNGHQASVRCLEIHGDLVVSGSYDTTAKIWSIESGQCLRTLTGHFSQIYAIAFDGEKIATGSLDTSVRIWDPHTGQCLTTLQGHTSLVGQLQLRNSTLVTGGSDGSVRVWSLRTYAPIHRLAAHDNSVTSLQFDDDRIVSGGSDGRVKVWDTKTGQLVRELSQPAEAVWRVAFESEVAVVMASRGGRTIMEVWNFEPPTEEWDVGAGGRSGAREVAMKGGTAAAAAAAAAATEGGVGRGEGRDGSDERMMEDDGKPAADEESASERTSAELASGEEGGGGFDDVMEQ